MKGCLTIGVGVVLGAAALLAGIVLISEKTPDLFTVSPAQARTLVDDLEVTEGIPEEYAKFAPKIAVEWDTDNRAILKRLEEDSDGLMSVTIVPSQDGRYVDSLKVWYDEWTVNQAARLISSLSASIDSTQTEQQIMAQTVPWLSYGPGRTQGDYERLGAVFVEVIDGSDSEGNTFIQLTQQPRF